MEITKERAAAILAAKGTPITTPGVYNARVTTCNDYNKVRAEGVTQVAIANFTLTTEHYDSKAKSLYKQGLYREASNQGLSLSILEGQYRPVPGEMVKVTVELVHLKASGDREATDALMARRIVPVPATTPAPITMEQWIEKAEGIEEESPSMIVEKDDVEVPMMSNE